MKYRISKHFSLKVIYWKEIDKKSKMENFEKIIKILKRILDNLGVQKVNFPHGSVCESDQPLVQTCQTPCPEEAVCVSFLFIFS